MFIIHQNPHQLRNRHRRVGVVNMNRNPIGKSRHAVMCPPVMTNNALNPGTGEEILLAQPQFFSGIVRVIRIQDLGDLINPFFLFQGEPRSGINRRFGGP